MRADDGEDDVLGGRRRAEFAVDRDRHRSSAASGAASASPAHARPRWCRCRRPARRMRRAWTCGCRRRRSSCPGCVSPCSGPMTWTMPCPSRPSDRGGCRTPSQFFRSTSTCLARDRVDDRLVDVHRRHVVVLRGDGEIGPPHLAAVQPQTVERLRRRHLVDEVEVDVEQIGLPGPACTTWRSHTFSAGSRRSVHLRSRPLGPLARSAHSWCLAADRYPPVLPQE